MGTDFATVAKLLANPARSVALDALMSGRAFAAGELAELAGVAASTMSEHLSGLIEGGLVTSVAMGRHRYYRVANEDVAAALEAFSRICPPMPVRSLRQSVAADTMKVARLCYDHLAGRLGVALLDRMRSQGWLVEHSEEGSTGGLAVTERGEQHFVEYGVDLDASRRARRRLAFACLDWTERRTHLAGALGAAITSSLLQRRWLTVTANARALEVTKQGEAGLRLAFDLDIDQLEWPQTG